MKTLIFFFVLTFVYSDNTIAIIGTNDIHGTAFPKSLVREDTGEQYSYGGLVYMGRLIQIIKEQYVNKVLFVDAGDQFQGGIESSKLISSGQIMNDFFRIMNINGSAIGNHEFDFGPSFLLPYLNNRESPNLAANLRSEKGEIDFLPKQKQSQMFEVANGIKIGVIGLSTIETPSTTDAFSSGLFPQFQFLPYQRIVINQSKKLKDNGANAILLVSHVGNDCPLDLTYGIWTPKTQQLECEDDQMTKLIDSLPQGTIDGVVQGHRHKPAHHYRKNIPYMGNINGGFYFNVLYLTFDEKKRIVDTKIQGPIPVCDRVFANTNRCNYLTKSELVKAGPLINWKFHNQNVYAHNQVERVFSEKWLPKMVPYLQEIVVNQIDMMKERNKQSNLGNLVSNLIHEVVPEADFVLVNPGLFRTQWVPGIIQYQHFYNMFPFQNKIQSFHISGKQLLQTLSIIQSGTKGFYQSWGLQIRVSLEGNEKQFISAQFYNGTQIQEDQQFRGASLDFLLNGGDDFKDVIGKVYTPRGVQNEGDLKEMLKPKLMKLNVIQEGSLIDENHPRLIVN